MKETIYLISVSTIRNSDTTWIATHMPLRHTRASRFRHENDRLLCYGAACLIKDVLGITNESLIKNSEHGKLYAEGYPCFNLSHSGEYAALVKSDMPVGIDIEPLDRKAGKVDRVAFSPEEIAWLESDREGRFLKLWTAKEALLKAIGSGFARDPKSIDTTPFFRGEGVRVDGREYFMANAEYNGYIISACFMNRVDELEIFEIY